MWVLLSLSILSGKTHTADVYDEQSNRIGRTEERQGRMEAFDTRANRIGDGVRQSDGSIEFRDPQGDRIGRAGTPRSDDSVIFENTQSKWLGNGKPDTTGRYQYQDRSSARRGRLDAGISSGAGDEGGSGPAFPQQTGRPKPRVVR